MRAPVYIAFFLTFSLLTAPASARLNLSKSPNAVSPNRAQNVSASTQAPKSTALSKVTLADDQNDDPPPPPPDDGDKTEKRVIFGGLGLFADAAEQAAARGKLIRSLQKSIKSLKLRRVQHIQKLKEYKANPNAFDNKGHLANNSSNPLIRQRVIRTRVEHLQEEIDNYSKQIRDKEAQIQKLQP